MKNMRSSPSEQSVYEDNQIRIFDIKSKRSRLFNIIFLETWSVKITKRCWITFTVHHCQHVHVLFIDKIEQRQFKSFCVVNIYMPTKQKDKERERVTDVIHYIFLSLYSYLYILFYILWQRLDIYKKVYFIFK